MEELVAKDLEKEITHPIFKVTTTSKGDLKQELKQVLKV